MVTLNIDWRFILIATDTVVARRHAEIGLRRLDRTEQDVWSLVLEELKSRGYSEDKVETELAYQEIYFLEEALPRLETYGILVMLFATYESVVKRLPGYVGAWTPADVTETRGDSFVAKAMRFYRERLGVPLFKDDKEESFVRRVADIRNAVGHATGQVSMLKKDLQRRFQQHLAAEEGLSVVDGSLHLDPAFVRKVAGGLDGAAHGLIERLKVAF